METSAKTASNVNEIFMAIGKSSILAGYLYALVSVLVSDVAAKKLPKNEPARGTSTGGQGRDNVKLNEGSGNQSGGCC
jgi:hypothetical protein